MPAVPVSGVVQGRVSVQPIRGLIPAVLLAGEAGIPIPEDRRICYFDPPRFAQLR